MLPDFTNAKVLLSKMLLKYQNQRTRHFNPSMRDATERVIHEGTGTTTENANSENFTHSMELKPIQTQASMSIDELISDPRKVFIIIDDIAKQMAEHQSKMMYDTISEVSERTGNISKRDGKVTPEIIFDMFDKIQFSFDKKGQPILPVIHAGTNMLDEIKEAIHQLTTESIWLPRFEKMIYKKKQEWNDRENNRKLVG